MSKDKQISHRPLMYWVFFIQVRGISQVISNTDLQYNQQTSNNDWVIAKLDSPLTLGGDVQAACLPSSASYLPTDSTEERCFASGWGTLSAGNSGNVKC